MQIRQKLTLSFLFVAMLVGVVGYVSFTSFHKFVEPLNNRIPEAIETVSRTSHLDHLAGFIRYYDEVLTQSARNYAFTQDKKWKLRYGKVEPKLDETIKKAIERGDEKDKTFFSNVDKANLALVEMEYKSIELVDNGQASQAVKILENSDYWDQKKIYEQALRDYINRRGAKYDEALSASTKAINLATIQVQNLITKSTVQISFFAFIALILSITIGLLTSRSISTPITKLKLAAIEIGKGKLNTKIGVNSNNEIGQLAASFNKMAEDLQTTTTSIDNLNAVNQQLLASDQQLRAANQQLQTNEEHLQKINHNIGERIKELTLLYGLSRLIQQSDITLSQIFQTLAELIPPGWHYPEITCARILFDDTEFKTDNFKKTQWKQSADIKISGQNRGAVEVYYLRECPQLDEGPFLKEERNLINGIAETLNNAIWRIIGEQQVKAPNHHLLARDQQLRAANHQLESEIYEREQAEKELEKLLFDMDERIKELNCMYGVINSIQQRKSLDDIFQDVVTIMPSSWKYPEITCARICFDGTEYVSKPFEETQWTQISDIVVKDKSRGSVKVCYLEKRPVEHEGPFLKEERHLIDGVATVLSEAITHKHIEEEIQNLAKFPSEDPNPVLRISANCKIIYANNAGTPILKAWKCREGQSLQPPQSKLVKEVLNLGKPATFDLDCHDRMFSVTMAPVIEADYVNVYGLDITELKLSKQTIKQVREQADKKVQFVSTVSHELRTPLTAMKGSIDILLNKAVGEINCRQEELLDVTKRNIDRLNILINDVLDFQKLEANKTRFDMQKNDINELIKEIKKTTSPLANKEGLKLITKLDETLPKMNFDRNSIIQVLTNLVNNAIKFTDKGSIKITTNKSDNTIRVSIEDTGIGIKKEDLPKLFDEFEQLSDVNNRKTGGTGLGLAISRKIIKEHNGTIWAESEFGQGTTVSFVLPVKERRSRA